jgi:hypothetical protein
MTTRSELIESISAALHSYTGVHETVTHLTSSLSDSATTATIASTDGARRGIAEIDDEMLYIEAVSGDGLQIPPFGRGYRGSTAVAHNSGAMVTFDPAFPRKNIGDSIDECLAGLFPALYQVKEVLLESAAIDRSYDLPTDVENILRVETKWDQDPADYWHPLVNWELEKTSTPVLNLYEGALPGWDVKVVYTAQFSPLTVDFDTSGIPESYRDLILYCVTAKMVRFLEPARLQLGSVENVSRAQLIQVGDAGRTATQLYALYQQRVAEERRRLLEKYPARPNFLAR